MIINMTVEVDLASGDELTLEGYLHTIQDACVDEDIAFDILTAEEV